MSYKSLLSFFGCLIGLPACSKSVRDRTFDLPMRVGPTQIHELTGGKDRPNDSELQWFARRLRFDHLDETIQADAFMTLTPGSGAASGGRYVVSATLRKGYTGGPPGSATELFIDAGEMKFVGPVAPPSARPGASAIIAGQVLVRPIAEGTLATIDDRYDLELPARQTIDIWFEPFRADLEFNVSLTREGMEMPAAEKPKADYSFDTAEDGVYELRVRAGRPAAKEPDRYSFWVAWGHAESAGKLAARQISWREPAQKKD